MMSARSTGGWLNSCGPPTRARRAAQRGVDFRPGERPAGAADARVVGTLTPEVAALGLAAAVTSPTSVLIVIALLSMSNGGRRGVAFMVGRLLGIVALALLLVFALSGQDFSHRRTTPSRTASAVEIAIGLLLLVLAARTHRRPAKPTTSASSPNWLNRLDRSHWMLGVVVGLVTVSYALTLAAGAEILKADVGVLNGSLAAVEIGRAHV